MLPDAHVVDRLLPSWSPAWTAAIDAAASAPDPDRLLRPVLSELGFDGLTCIVLASAAADCERTLDMWCTTAPAWTTRYRDLGYALVDPRITMTARRLAPVIWDAADIDGDWTVRRFRRGRTPWRSQRVRRRVPRTVRHAHRRRIRHREITARRRTLRGDRRHVGQPDALAASLRDRVIRHRLRSPPSDNSPQGLTHREHQCLRMAAHGLTSGDIGGKLGIAERTVNFHMHNVLRKMEAVNRPEAIARALARGVLRAETIG